MGPGLKDSQPIKNFSMISLKGLDVKRRQEFLNGDVEINHQEPEQTKTKE